jgi:predicted TPR repeat methyltransferase
MEPMPTRIFLTSGDLMADRRYDFARDLQLKGDLPGAADLLLQAADLAPNFVTAWFSLGDIRETLGEREAAITAFRNAWSGDPDDRHGASLRLMRLGAEPLAAMPQGYVKVLFDQYAKRFESALVDDLRYRGPELLFRAVLSVRAAARAVGGVLERDHPGPRIMGIVGADLAPEICQGKHAVGRL